MMRKTLLLALLVGTAQAQFTYAPGADLPGTRWPKVNAKTCSNPDPKKCSDAADLNDIRTFLRGLDSRLATIDSAIAALQGGTGGGVLAPTITAISPSSGPAGTTVTITGTNLTGTSNVKFNGLSAYFSVLSATQVSAIAPDSVSTGILVVTTPGGTASSGTFTVAPSAAVTSIVADNASAVFGGSTVQLSGTVVGTGGADTSIRWSLAPTADSCSTLGASVTTGGVFTPPTSSQTPIGGACQVTATAAADANFQSIASVTILPPAPSFSPSAGTYSGTQAVTLSESAPGSASIYYTTDGSTPTTASSLYSAPISVANTQTVKAMAVINNASSSVASAAYTIQAAVVAATFPGCQGSACSGVGGRGGKIYTVKVLTDTTNGGCTPDNPSTTCSLRDCVEATNYGTTRAAADGTTGQKPRVCVFSTGGTIPLNAQLAISTPYISIAGQTAPGGGIQITDGGASWSPAASYSPFRIRTHDIDIRFLRIRSQRTDSNCGIAYMSEAADSWNVVTDHISIAGFAWDNLCYGAGAWQEKWYWDYTVSWSLLTDPIASRSQALGANIASCSISGSGLCTSTSYAQTMADRITDFDMHHNVIMNASHRYPKHNNGSGHFVSNLLYNWYYYASEIVGKKDLVNNHWKAGPSTTHNASKPVILTYNVQGTGPSVAPSLYLSGNYWNYDGGKTAWADLTCRIATEDIADACAETPAPAGFSRASPYSAAHGISITPDTAASLVTANGSLLPAYPTSGGVPGVGASASLTCAGAWAANRDSNDTATVSQIVNDTGPDLQNGTFPTTIISIPSLTAGSACDDADSDGLPNTWESTWTVHLSLAANALTPTGTEVPTHLGWSGTYTNLDAYLSGLTSTP